MHVKVCVDFLILNGFLLKIYKHRKYDKLNWFTEYITKQTGYFSSVEPIIAYYSYYTDGCSI